jgi:hypothetical protein
MTRHVFTLVAGLVATLAVTAYFKWNRLDLDGATLSFVAALCLGAAYLLSGVVERMRKKRGAPGG